MEEGSVVIKTRPPLELRSFPYQGAPTGEEKEKIKFDDISEE